MKSEYPELSKSKASLYSRLGSAKVRRKEGLFMAVGEKCVADTRKTFDAVVVIGTPEWIEHNEKDWDPSLIRVASATALAGLSGMNSAPEVIVIYRIPQLDITDLRIPEKEAALLLDGIQDPGNFGSILRTADWFGITSVFASRESADLYNPKVIQATMGAVSRVKVIYCDLTEVIRANPDREVYGTLLDGKNIYQTDLKNDAIIIMGNEGKGLSSEMRDLVTHPILIPPYNPVNHGESLNVGAATAITLAAFRFHLTLNSLL